MEWVLSFLYIYCTAIYNGFQVVFQQGLISLNFIEFLSFHKIKILYASAHSQHCALNLRIIPFIAGTSSCSFNIVLPTNAASAPASFAIFTSFGACIPTPQ